MSKLKKAAALVKQGEKTQRLQAIRFLAKSEDERVLKVLAWAVKNDPDPEVQAYARSAYQYLEQSIELEPSYDDDPFNPYGGESLYADEPEQDYSPQAGSLFEFDDEDDMPDPAAPQRSRTGPIDYDARKLIREAMEAHIEEDDKRAIQRLIAAHQKDDRILQDNEAQNIAESIMGIDGPTALRTIIDEDIQVGLLEGAPGNGIKKGKASSEVTWGTAWLDIGIFGLIIIVGMISCILVFSARFTPLVADIANNPSQYAAFYDSDDTTPEDMQNLLMVMQAGVPLLVLGAVGIGLMTVISNLIGNYAVHFAAVSFFGGERPASVTLDRLFNFQSVIFGVSFGAVLLALFVLPVVPEAYTQPENGVILPVVIGVSILLNVVLGLVSPIGQIVVVSRAQDIGLFSGCLSIFVGSLLLSVFGCGFGFILSLVVGSLGLLGL